MTDFFAAYGSLIEQLGIASLVTLSFAITLRAGVFSLGQVGFVAIGGYAAAILSLRTHLPAPLIALLGVVVTLLVGAPVALLPFRLSGIYLALATIAFVEIVQVLLINLTPLTGGPFGLLGLRKRIGAAEIWLLVAIAVIAVVAVYRSRWGAVMDMSRIDPLAAETMGISTRRISFAASMASTLLASTAGVLSTLHSYFISPDGYTFRTVIDGLTFATVGGPGSVVGALVATFGLTLAPEFVRPFKENADLVFGLLLAATILFLPAGIGGTWNRLALTRAPEFFIALGRRVRRPGKPAEATGNAAD